MSASVYLTGQNTAKAEDSYKKIVLQKYVKNRELEKKFIISLFNREIIAGAMIAKHYSLHFKLCL